MTRSSKRKIKAKEQERDNKGKFSKKLKLIDEFDEDDSGWDDDMSLLNEKKALEDKPFELVWTDNTHLEQKKRGPYLTGKIKKSTYFDKYGPNGSFTKAAKGNTKITTFMNKDKPVPDDFIEVLDDINDEKEQNYLNIGERIENLKTELKEQYKILTVIEYNKKQAIYEYLKRLDENRGKEKIKVSKEAAQLVFINCAPHRARTIQYWANFWLQYNHLPISHQGKHKKTIRLIDDKDIAEECYAWIRSQDGTTTPLKFKEFVK